LLDSLLQEILVLEFRAYCIFTALFHPIYKLQNGVHLWPDQLHILVPASSGQVVSQTNHKIM